MSRLAVRDYSVFSFNVSGCQKANVVDHKMDVTYAVVTVKKKESSTGSQITSDL